MTVDTLSLGSCECGACTFAVKARPKARFICHCTICQAYTGNAFSDVTVMRAKDVAIANRDLISFRKYRPPPNIDRGLCGTCGKPVVELGGFGPFAMIFIPSGNIRDQALLPPARMHIFYHSRVKDVDDSLPTYSGYFSSQFALTRSD